MITTAKISACRTRRNAGHGHLVLLPTVPTVLTVTLLILPALITVLIPTPRILQALTVRIPTVHIHLILLAPTRWFPCLALAAISCTTILPTPPFTATAR